MPLRKECPRCRYRNADRRRRCARCGATLVPGGVVYWVDVQIRGKRIRKRIGPSREEAERYELELKRLRFVEQTEEPSQNESAPPLRVSELWLRYWPWCQAHNRSPETKLYRWKTLEPFFGDLILTEVTPALVERYRRRRLKSGVRPATVNKEVGLLRHMLNMAVRWGYLGENPIEKIESLPEENDDVWQYLTKEEFERVYEAINPTYRDLLVFLVYTGLRVGEALRLRWRDVDLRKGVLLLRGTRTKGRKTFGIPLHRLALEVLLRRREALNGNYRREGRIFRHSEDWFRRAFKKALEAAGLPESFRVHDLRHTFASWLAMAGVPVQEIQMLLGHRQITTTMRYAHLNPEILRGALEKI